MGFIGFLFFAACLSSVNGNYQYVLAPNVIRLENEETLLIGIFGNGQNQKVTVYFEYLNKTISKKVTTVTDAEHPEEVTVKVTADDLFKDIDASPKFRERPKSIKLVCNGTYGVQVRDIALSYTSGYLIVQTDKPLYNPSQTVLVRVLAMDESMRPIKDKQLNIDLISPTNMTVGRFNIDPGISKNGFHRGEFQLPPFPDFGIWTIKAKLGGKLETYAIAPIEVREFVLPSFGVEISTGREYILPNQADIVVTVSAKYVYGKPVEGMAGLNINVRKRDVSGPESVATMGRQPLNDGRAYFTVDIKKLVKDIGGQFPTDAVLKLSSTVYESATGKEESGADESVMFVKCPFKFDFSRSKTTYRKGFTYYMQMNMLHANGKPAVGGVFNLTIDGSRPEQHQTNNNGHYLAQIPVEQKDLGRRTIKVYSPAFDKCEAELVLQPYTGDSQIVVEKVEREGGASFIQANTDINMNNVAKYSGILMLITARGKIVKTKYFPPSNNPSFKLEQNVVDQVSPVGRVFAFYVHNAKLVADSSIFYVDAKCREQLVLHPEEPKVKPGESNKLTVTGPSGMWVGFNVIDKALLLLNNKNVLKVDKVFDEMEAHDLGCGAGGGTNSEEIFKNAGLTILINANVNAASIQRETPQCAAKKRKRRAVLDENGCYFGVNPVCCEQGVQYAHDVIHTYETDKHHFNPDLSQPVPYTECYSKARKLAETYKDKLPSKCPMAFYEACVVTMTAELSESDVASGRSVFNSIDQYQLDVEQLAEYGVKGMTIRRIFDTSFFFEEHMISDQSFTTNLKYRDSITEWTIQAIGISENTGVCIAVPKEVKAFKEFFIQVDLPYKVTRKENFNVKVTVFNYIAKQQVARVYLKGVSGLCYSASPGQQSPPQEITLPPNGASTVTFPMIPLEAGTYPIIVSAFVTNKDTPSTDIVEKKLLVVNEGILERLSFTVCLDPNNQMENCIQEPEVKSKERLNGVVPTVRMEVELPLPLSALPGTAFANAYIQSNLMGTPVSCVLEGVDKMFNEPQGCGEQTMIYTAPIVYGMYFLKQTGKMEAQHEESGTKYMMNGITRQQSMYQKDDGSYAAWKTYPTSLWLTAFVAKVFCQAEQVVKLQNTDSLKKTLAYISKNNSVASGHFQDDSPVIHREMQGALGQGDRKTDPSLTAFVLTSLQECTERTVEVQDSIKRAMAALEQLPVKMRKNNPYLLAISTYALALSNSTKTNDFRRELYEIKRNDNGRLFWSNSGFADSYAVETTAYALLAFLKFDDFTTCHKIVAWLTAQSDAIGKWRSTQDTVVAMQALATYSARTYNPEVDLHVEIEKGNWKKTTVVNSENALLQKLIPDLPLKTGDSKFRVMVSGRGSGVLKIDLFYNRKARDDEICPFDISPIDRQPVDRDIADNPNKHLGECNVCGLCKEPEVPIVDVNMFRDKREAIPNAVPVQTCIQFSVKSRSSDKNSNDAGMSIVKVNLETFVKVVESDLIKMQNEGVFPRYEMPKDGQGFVIIYLDNITSAETKLIFRLEDHFSGNDSSRQPATIKVYDYYKPERSCIKQYGIGSNHGHEIKYTCEERSDQCQCMQSQCSKQVNQELVDMALKFSSEKNVVKRKPVDALMDYACDFEKANFVVKVRVTKVGYNLERDVQFATAVIEEELNKGGHPMKDGDEMEFEWHVTCTQPELKVGKSYYIIAKDGTTFTDEQGKARVKYDLTGTALVIDPEFRPLLRTVMNNFVKELKKNIGCNN